MRTLIKAGHPRALAVLGYRRDSPVRVKEVRLAPQRVQIGGKVKVEIEVANPSDREASVLLDFAIHFQKARGTTSAKVFKGGELVVPAGGTGTVRKTVSFAQHSTRTHYPGPHRLDVSINGVTAPGGVIDVV